MGTSTALTLAAQRIFEVMCGGPVDWAKHAADTNDDNLFRSADWERCLAYARAALPDVGTAIVISHDNAKIIIDMMEEFWRRQELSSDESRIFLALCSLTGIGRPVPEHGSGP